MKADINEENVEVLCGLENSSGILYFGEHDVFLTRTGVERLNDSRSSSRTPCPSHIFKNDQTFLATEGCRIQWADLLPSQVKVPVTGIFYCNYCHIGTQKIP